MTKVTGHFTPDELHQIIGEWVRATEAGWTITGYEQPESPLIARAIAYLEEFQS